MFERVLEVLETTIVGHELLITKQLQFIEGLPENSSSLARAALTLEKIEQALARLSMRRLAIFRRLVG